jgi:hypothetical protein
MFIMSCELFSGLCTDCDLNYCPADIEEINFTYRELKDAVLDAALELEQAERELNDYYEDHKEIL